MSRQKPSSQTGHSQWWTQSEPPHDETQLSQLPRSRQQGHQPAPENAPQGYDPNAYGTPRPTAAHGHAPAHGPSDYDPQRLSLAQALAEATSGRPYPETAYAQPQQHQPFPTFAPDSAYPVPAAPAHRDPGRAGYPAAPEGWPAPTGANPYDLTNYIASDPRTGAPGYPAHAGHPGLASGSELHVAPEARDNQYRPGGYPGFDENVHADPHAPAPHAAYPAHYGADPEAGFEGEVAPEQGSGRKRGLIVATALVGAIGAGMGLAYAYKQLTGTHTAARPPVIEAARTATKTAPDKPGGKLFPNADKQFTQRLGDAGAGVSGASAVPPVVPPPPSSETDASGMRKVSTLTIGRDGTVAAPAPSAPPPTSGVPGLILDSFGPPATPRGAAAPPPAAPARPSAAAASPPPAPVPAAPRVIARAEPTVAPPVPAAPVAAPAPAAPPPVVAKKPMLRGTTPPVVASAPAAAATAPPSSASSGRGGYVAVLASHRSHKDALETFVDMQSKYGAVLSGGTPEVREVNLGEKGVWYRLLYGPSRSLDATKEVCAQLKSQGFAGQCWPVKY
jgi:hypothetical protein